MSRKKPNTESEGSVKAEGDQGSVKAEPRYPEHTPKSGVYTTVTPPIGKNRVVYDSGGKTVSARRGDSPKGELPVIGLNSSLPVSRTGKERAASLRAWAASNPRDTPLLSDQAMSREAIYDPSRD
jgi:hypothetical protein